jgi:hypothetical protein
MFYEAGFPFSKVSFSFLSQILMSSPWDGKSKSGIRPIRDGVAATPQLPDTSSLASDSPDCILRLPKVNPAG